LEFIGEVLGLRLVLCLLYYYIILIHAWRAVCKVHNVRINCWEICFLEWHSSSNRLPYMAIMYVVIGHVYTAEVSLSDL
jgi:hypothetical protein